MIRVDVLGEPHPKGSKRAFVSKGGRAVQIESSGQGLTTWRRRLATAVALVAPSDGPMIEPVAVFLTFRLAAPARGSRWPWPIPRNRGDIDKLCRAVLDELSSVVIADDSQVALLCASKVFDARPGAEVIVMPLMPLADPEFGDATWDDLSTEFLTALGRMLPDAEGGEQADGQRGRTGRGAAPLRVLMDGRTPAGHDGRSGATRASERQA